MNGGIFDAMRNLTFAIAAEKRYSLSVFSARDAYTNIDEPLWDGITTHAFPVRGPRIFGYAPGLAQALEASNADILHVHGIWMYPSVVARRWAREARPYVVSPHGLLKPLALRNSRWKKRLAALLYEREHLRHAACLHALNAAEAEAFRRYGLKNPICVIPNGTTLSNDAVCRHSPHDRSILYLGRIHPLKGLRNLIKAWVEVRSDAERAGWRLIIAGRDQSHHRAELERLADQLQVRSSIDFFGPQFDADKERTLAAASAIILPSESEGLPMSILEAWSRQLPVLMTRECNLPEGAQAGAAILMDSDSKSIAEALRQLFSLTEQERETMGRNGRSLVEDRFQWPHLARSMTEVYDWILGHGSKPDCVVV
ncbi:MAG TPA: glycosyltransferase [Terracidiphilus sp.]|jgi:poly(glycerol-phosphate) alpha-glucosyltransferase